MHLRPATVAILALAGLAVIHAQRAPDLLTLIDRPRVPLAPEVSGRRFSFASEAGERVPGILAAPSSGGRHPVVIILHGTGGSKEGMAPLLDVLAARGFLAVAIDGRFHGERERRPGDYDRAILQAYRTGQGHPLFYDTVWDVTRLVDYLRTRPDVDPARIGLIGISKGGIETYLTAAVDPRIAVAIPVIAVQSFRWGLEHDAWIARVETFQAAIAGAARDEHLHNINAALVRKFYDRVVPGIYADFDGPTMLPRIAPRPLMVINGDSDARTPLDGVREATAAAERAYSAAGASDRFRLIVQPNAGHEFTEPAQRAAIDWLVRWLKP
jgi:dipeptidyl aminopeptidase/acylaminoacyl peptidase